MRDAPRPRRRPGARSAERVQAGRSGRAAAAGAPRRSRRRRRRGGRPPSAARRPARRPRSLVGVSRELDQPEHQRDPDRVVRSRLALEDRVRAALDLAVAEHREHDGGIGRRDRGADQAGGHPLDPERPVGEDRDERRPWQTCPARPATTTGMAAARKRRRPIDAPPSKRITTARRPSARPPRARRGGSRASAAATRNARAPNRARARAAPRQLRDERTTAKRRMHAGRYRQG